jgi:hypothetical protein
MAGGHARQRRAGDGRPGRFLGADLLKLRPIQFTEIRTRMAVRPNCEKLQDPATANCSGSALQLVDGSVGEFSGGRAQVSW